MEPVTAVGLAAGLIQLIDATMKVIVGSIDYLKDVKGAAKDREVLSHEAASLYLLLTNLRFRVEGSGSANSFSNVCGPLTQIKTEMEDLAVRLKPESGIRGLGKTLVWTLDKNEIKKILSKIERLKAQINLALQSDHL